MNRWLTKQVICGDINYYINVSVDQMINGGAIAMERLFEDFDYAGASITLCLLFQFDNNGENKITMILKQ